MLDKDLKAEKLSDYFNKDKEYVLVDLSSVSCPDSNKAFYITKIFADKTTEKLQVVSILQSNYTETYKHFGKLSTDNWAMLCRKLHEFKHIYSISGKCNTNFFIV